MPTMYGSVCKAANVGVNGFTRLLLITRCSFFWTADQRSGHVVSSSWITIILLFLQTKSSFAAVKIWTVLWQANCHRKDILFNLLDHQNCVLTMCFPCSALIDCCSSLDGCRARIRRLYPPLLPQIRHPFPRPGRVIQLPITSSASSSCSSTPSRQEDSSCLCRKEMQLDIGSIDASFRGQSIPISLAGLNSVKDLVKRVAKTFELESVKLVLKGGKAISESTSLSLAETGKSFASVKQDSVI